MMATVLSSEGKNNLELYLNDIFEKECIFKIEKEEIEFIKTGIETLVQDLVDIIITDDSFHKELSEYIEESPSLMEKLYNEKSIIEVYFPMQSDSSLQKYVAINESLVKTAKSTIIKVGSFYDGTKNNFPDEFDFIFPLLGVRSPKNIQYQYMVNYLNFKETVHKHAKHIHYTFPSEKHEVTRELKLCENVETHGPAHMLQFIYSNEHGDEKHIHVDLVPAYKIIGSNSLQWFVEKVKKYVEPRTFREEILAAGSSLIVRDDLAFTEIEKHFMKTILSKKHVKVYRILKYIVNGHGDGENFYEMFGDPYYSSYRIKILIIYHHEACKNTDTEDLGPCVLQVLEEMSKYESTGEFPNFIGTTLIPGPPFWLLPAYLKSTMKSLQTMQASEDSYCYERDKTKSVLGQYLAFNIKETQNLS